MNQSPTIHVPTKRTDEVDWANPLKRYIQTTYQEDPEKYADEANSIHRLRQDMRGAGKDITGRDLLYRYYGQLELLDLRFPVDENHIRISFTWYDAFTLKATSQFSLAYEKASTIFNIASVLSAIAATQNRSEPEGLKRAFNFFQASAGMYTYINDNFLHAPSTDLSRDTVKLLSQLMLTQAQECFLEQSLVKNKPALIAKLAAQAGWSYGNIVENMGDLISRSVFDRSWLTVCQIKQKYLASIAQYQKSLACEGEGKYGECVCRLSVAETLAKEANKLSNNFVSSFSPTVTQTLPPDAATSLQDLTKSNLALISEKNNSATKDNDMVYHEAVPQESVIPPIDKLNAVKQMPIQDLYGHNEIQKVIGQDIFQRLIPLSVHESASLYSEEKAKMVRSETERCDVSNGELEAALEYMKLPGALVKFKTNSNNESRYLNELASPTSEVKQWAQLIKTEEQKDTIKDLQMTLNGLKSKAKEVLEEVSLTLEKEQRDYDGMKAKYGDLWTQSPSKTVFRQDLLDHIESLEKAANSDQHLLQRYNQYLSDIMILQTGENSDDLEKIFAEALASPNNDTFVGGRRVSNAESLLDVDTSKSEEDINTKLHKIEECLSNLNKVRKERMDTLNDLKEKTHQDDISHLLILNKKSQNIEPQLFATELEKFSPYRNRITASIHHQQALLQDLTANFKSLMEGDEAKTLQTRWDHAERRRREVCDRLRKAKDSYLEVKEGLR
ncbi:BRO1-like domain-containing protein [Glomus cerebriforme]|uniref:BRO domain-containing protein 1 n=1 Tax=Glomus cerebriforme TaxID=658196 RepID=A0A397SZU4_9GLOM|nr:BRO1-like domain-containing protein [Glomus cerebriforme]